MDLTYAFRLPLSVDDAWATLADAAGVAAHVRGAVVDSVVGELVVGHLKVKVGPVAVRYDGALTVQSQDAEARVAVLRAKGTEARGEGDAAATVTVQVAPDGADADASIVTVAAVLDVTGRMARFGRGPLGDVGERMVRQLAEGLGGELVEVAGPYADGDEGDVDDVTDDDAPEGDENDEDDVDDVTDDDAPESDVTGDDAPEDDTPPAPIDVVEVEMIETELGDPFEAVEPDAADVDPAPLDAPVVVGADDPQPGPAAPPVSAPSSATSTAKKVGPVLIGIALLWLLKKLLSRSKP